ncbi:MAG: hypothetical protein ACI88H_001304 [Cocleimonas sp.]|jgi:hypothetical protein
MAKSIFSKHEVIKRSERPDTRNVISMDFSVLIKMSTMKNSATKTNLEFLMHVDCDKEKPRLQDRVAYITNFVKSLNNKALSPSSKGSVVADLKRYICYCDAKNITPFSKKGYFLYFGNDGYLWQQVNHYKPSLHIFQYAHNQRLGIKESSAYVTSLSIIAALNKCGFNTSEYEMGHVAFSAVSASFKPYSPSEEKSIIARLTDVFLVLAAELIAIKKDNIPFEGEISVPISVGGKVDSIAFTLPFNTYISKAKKVSSRCAFNQAMTIGYHLFCYFTAWNDTQVRELSRNFKVEKRDKTLEVVKLIAHKARSGKPVQAHLSNEVESESCDIKKTGLNVMLLLQELSDVYSDSSNDRLIYCLDENGDYIDRFPVFRFNAVLVPKLNLLKEDRSALTNYFIEQFYEALNGKAINIDLVIDDEFERKVSKTYSILMTEYITQNAQKFAYAALSCLTDKPIKNAILPLIYNEKDENGNITIAMNYTDKSLTSIFTVSAVYKPFLEDLEKWAGSRSTNTTRTKRPRYLIPFGHYGLGRQWRGLSPLTYTALTKVGISSGEYFINLNSSRFRKTTSDNMYEMVDGDMQKVANLLGNAVATAEQNYVNGHPELNKVISSQSMKVLQRITTKAESLIVAKAAVCQSLGVEILSYDESKKRRLKANANGIACDGVQNVDGARNTQNKTNNKLGIELPCSEYDTCHACKSAKGIDSKKEMYRLLSFIDLLEESLDLYPNAREAVHSRIESFKATFYSASEAVCEAAMQEFNQNGRHPRLTMDYVITSLNGSV